MRIKKMNELYYNNIYTEITDLECDYLLSIDGDYLNIDNDIFIFVGYNPYSGVKRIKISTDKNDRYKTFSIDIDKLVIIGDYNKSIITNDVINNIFRWIKINRDILEELSKEDVDAGSLLKLLKIN
jgi:hypothetical protein